MASGSLRGIARAFRQIGPVRLVVTLLLLASALAIARYSWQAPLAVDAERGLYDLRFTRAAPRVGQDERITLVTYNDGTLEQLGKRSPLDRRMMAQALRALDGLGPRAIGIDILIDQAQPEDAELIDTLRQMRTPTFLAFTSQAANPGQIEYWQEEFLRNFLQQVSSGPVRPASIRLESDIEGVMRRWPERPAELPPLLANALAPQGAAFGNFRGAIAYRLPFSAEQGVFAELPVESLALLSDPALAPEERAAVADQFRETISGRYILLGGNIQNLDDFQTPITRQTGETSKGVQVHAHMLAQILDSNMPAAPPGWALWLAALAVVLAGALSGVVELRSGALIALLVLQLAVIVFLPFWLAGQGVDTLELPAAGWGAGWLLAFVAVGIAARAVGSEQRKFAGDALGKYLPADVANEIMRNPDQLALSGEKREIYAVFTDLEGFTKLSHAIEPEQLSILLNRYLDMLSDTVLEHGGTIDKFVGDAVVAFWGAPIAREDDADRAVLAAIAMFEAGEVFRTTADPGLPPIGVTRVGLHRGEAVVGNFGGQRRIQYTALGDGMNTAARLESANKALKTTMLVSLEAMRETSLDLFRPMGRIVLSGRATPIEVWEPAPRLDAGLRRRLRELWERFDSGDESALPLVEDVAAGRPDDAALHNFVYRLREAGPGGYFVLGSK